MKLTHLTCDYMINPIGYDFDRPAFGWYTLSDAVNASQSAYRLQITSGNFDHPLLDTGRVESSLSVCIRPDIRLAPRTRYFWRVRIWDQDGQPSPWSDAAFFETARYDEAWDAEWIGAQSELPLLRKVFSCEKPLRRARIYACGVGLYTLNLNGEQVGDEYLAPGFCPYDSYLPYQTYDVTDRIRPGDNAVGAMLGNGYYKGRVNWPEIRERFGDRRNIFGESNGFICEICLEYEDGSRTVVSTDETWKAAEGPYLRAEIYDGEVYDARKLPDGWCLPAFDDSTWERAQILPLSGDLRDRLQARLNLPIRLHEIFRPLAVLHTPSGETVLDFGQNCAALLRFETEAPCGTELHFQFGEALDRDGNFYRENMRTALAEIRYIADGRRCSYLSAFTFFGFRYVKVTGWPGEVDPGDFESIAIYSDMETTGSFSCSDERVNQLFRNSLWSQKSNFVDLPTDCPQRDERMGWTGDAQVFAPTASMHMQTAPFFRKYMHDLALEQAKDGYVPVTVPNILRKTGIWQLPIAGWSDAATIIPWTMYLYFGDTAILERQYASMKAWVDFIQSRDAEHLNLYRDFQLGDWLAQDTKDPDNFFGLTPTDLIGTAYYARSARIVERTARVLGLSEDAAHYGDLADRVEEAFRREYVSPSGRVISETQTAGAVALDFDLLTPSQRPVAASHLAERVRIDHETLTTGFIGTPCLCPALSDHGYNEYAYALLLQTRCPSWLYEVAMGATTTWERWNSVREDGNFGPVGMNSLNHYAFGAICEWLYRTVAGVRVVESAPAFHRVCLQPQPNRLLSSAEAEILTGYGPLASAWTLQNGQIELTFQIPFNMTAEIHLPDAEGMEILENGESVSGTVFERGSGKWTYVYTPSGKTIDRRPRPMERPDI